MKLLKTYKKYSVKLLNMTKINNGIYRIIAVKA